MSHRLFHARIQVQHWLLLAIVLGVALYSFWYKNGILVAITFLFLVVLIERMIHTTYTLTDEVLRLHTSRFVKDKTIPLGEIERVERISRLRLFGHDFQSFLLITYGGGKQVAVTPQNEQDFLSAVERKRHPSSLATVLLAMLFACSAVAQAQDIVPTAARNETVQAELPVAPDLQMPWDQHLTTSLQLLAAEAEASPYTAGICVYDLTADSLLFAFNQQKVLRPASTQKVMTAVAALDILGRNHRATTRVFCTGNVEKCPMSSTNSSDKFLTTTVSVLHGNVVVVGGYDPLLSHDDLKAMAAAVRELGIDSIDGRVVADVSMTDTLSLGSGWCWDDVPSSFVPYLSPLFFNHAQPLDGGSSKFMAHPERYFARIFHQELRNCGVHIAPFAYSVSSSDALAGNGSARAVYAVTHTLEEVLERMMKRSDNLHAESVFYLLAGNAKPRGATRKEGAQQVETVLRRAGVDLAGIEVADGSGLSLYDYLTAASHVAMLRYAYLRPQIFDPLFASLPIAGVDGTLQRRMTTSSARNRVRAKTGTVEGVSSLAGYATASNGHLLAFSIILNGVLKNSAGHDFQDRICRELTR